MPMTKKDLKKTSEKQAHDYEPTRVIVMVSFVAVLALVLFGGLALLNAL
jgi:hypothetical protein